MNLPAAHDGMPSQSHHTQTPLQRGASRSAGAWPPPTVPATWLLCPPTCWKAPRQTLAADGGRCVNRSTSGSAAPVSRQRPVTASRITLLRLPRGWQEEEEESLLYHEQTNCTHAPTFAILDA